jgi:hypothetical protein
MNFTSTKLANGKFEISCDGKVIRKQSTKSWSAAWVYTINGFDHIRFAADAQLRRLIGEPKIYEIAQK